MNKIYINALRSCLEELNACKNPRGMEPIIQRAIARLLNGSRTEVPLREVGAIGVDDRVLGRLDIVHENHGIELKVVRMPRLESTPSKALYDIGQLTADYWRLSTATKLTSGELLILVYGSLVTELKSGTAICRELHNRLFVDFQTSTHYSELYEQKTQKHRKRQINCAKIMGVDRPCNRPAWKVQVDGKYALVSVPVIRS